jgi:RNA methyltransferase, TrmH family
MHYISSVANEQVKHVVSLQNKWYRQEHGQFVAQGTRACTQLFEKYEPVIIYITEDYHKTHDPELFKNFQEIIIGVAEHVMDKMSTAKNASGIIAVFKIPAEKPLPQTGPGLVLVDVSDPGNLGTLIRTAAAMAINEIILVGGVDPYNPKVIQSTAGCMTSVNLYQTTWQALQAQPSLQLCALIVKGGKTPDQIHLKHTFLVVGNEAHGLTPHHVEQCSESMTIPMPGHAESLNAAIAGAIGLYLMKQQN